MHHEKNPWTQQVRRGHLQIVLILNLYWKINFSVSKKCWYNDSYGDLYLLLMWGRHRNSIGFSALLSELVTTFVSGDCRDATFFPWQGKAQHPAQSGHALDCHNNVRSFLVFFTFYRVVHQKKEHSQHVLIFFLHKQDTGQLSDWKNFYSQSICIWSEQLSWEWNEKSLFLWYRELGQIGQRVASREVMQFFCTVPWYRVYILLWCDKPHEQLLKTFCVCPIITNVMLGRKLKRGWSTA